MAYGYHCTWFVNNIKNLREKYNSRVLAIKSKKVVAVEGNIHKLLSKLKDKDIPQEEVLIKQIRPQNEITISCQ